MTFLDLVLLAIAVFGLVSLTKLRDRLSLLENTVDSQRTALDELKRRLRAFQAETREVAHPAPAAPPAQPKPAAIEAPAVVQAPPVVEAPPVIKTPPVAETAASAPPAPPAGKVVPVATAPPARVPIVPTPVVASTPFDWESIIGVKLFSAVAGIALVLAAVFFLKYSMDHGWLAPPVRVGIGLVVATALLVVCERRAARNYPVTANALDAAAIAILFSTFYAAHVLWHLIPVGVAFGLLAIVTALAVLLSIRRNSMFIAVLGLLGGFATPALLSTGENRPIPLFAYLLLLNIGLAWVASRKKWAVLTILTLVLTALYQWVWVLKFLSQSPLSLAMGIFLLFAVVSSVALTFGRTGDQEMDTTLDGVGLGTSAMPLVFAAYIASVPAYGANAALMFGFLLLVDAGLAAVAIARRPRNGEASPLLGGEQLHAFGAVATVLVCAIWFTRSYSSATWMIAMAFTAAFVVLYSLAPIVAAVASRPFNGIGRRAEYAAPVLLFVFAVLAGIEPAAAAPLIPFGVLFGLLALIAWRAVTSGESGLYFVAAFFAVTAEAAWSAKFLSADHLRAAIALYGGFGVFYLGVPLLARSKGRELEPAWGTGTLTVVSVAMLLFLATGETAPLSLWGLALLLAILNAGLFIESASGGVPWLAAIGGMLSWLVLAVWWTNAAASVGLLPSLLVLVGLTLLMFTGYAWASSVRRIGRQNDEAPGGFRQGIYLGLVGHLFLFFIAQDAHWSLPPWPLLGSLTVMTLAASVASTAIAASELHAAATIAASVVVFTWTLFIEAAWARTAIGAAEAVVAYSLLWIGMAKRTRLTLAASSVGALVALYVAELALVAISMSNTSPGIATMTAAHVVNITLILAIAWKREWVFVAPAAVVPAGLAVAAWSFQHPQPADWKDVMVLAASLYAVFTAYPFVLHRRASDSRDPYLTAVAGSVFFFFAARTALMQGGFGAIVGIVPVAEAAILALLLRELLKIQTRGTRDLGRLAFVAGASLAFVTVAIPLQLKHQWITIGWALEGAALAWLYLRIPHRKLLYSAAALMAAAFARLALNPAIFIYEPRGMRVFNWYLYTYLLCAAAMLLAGWLFSKTDDEIVEGLPPARSCLPAAGVILLFILLNIEIADFYALGPEIAFKFRVSLAQDLTYTIGWLIFGLGLLTAGIYLQNRAGRIAAVVLITVTTLKAFLYDMASLGGLYRVGSLVGLAISLSLVALALQKFVLATPREAR